MVRCLVCITAVKAVWLCFHPVKPVCQVSGKASAVTWEMWSFPWEGQVLQARRTERFNQGFSQVVHFRFSHH